jgi:hypothetical protein
MTAPVFAQNAQNLDLYAGLTADIAGTIWLIKAGAPMPLAEEDRAVIATTSPLTVGNLEYAADDSIDFYVRHGRTLHARAAGETITLLLRALRSPRLHRPGSRTAWRGHWSTTPRADCGHR